MPARRPGGGARARREAGQGGAGSRQAQYYSIYGITADSRRCIRRPVRAGQIGAQKAGGPRPATVPGAAAPSPQQASGRWHRRPGPASRCPGGTYPGFGPDGPLTGRATPGSRAPGGRCPAPKPREGTLMPAMRPLPRPGGHRRHRHLRSAGRLVSRPPGPLRLAATCRQDAPPGRRPSARSPVGGHQGAAHRQSRRWHDWSSHSVSGCSCRRGARPPQNADSAGHAVVSDLACITRITFSSIHAFVLFEQVAGELDRYVRGCGRRAGRRGWLRGWSCSGPPAGSGPARFSRSWPWSLRRRGRACGRRVR